MILRCLFREFGDTNIISCTAGSAAVTGGPGCKFTDLKPHVKICSDDGIYLGWVASITDDTHMNLGDVNPDGFSETIWWADWSMWRISSGSINKRVESENDGEAGVVVFDNVDMSFYYGDSIHVPAMDGAAADDYLNPVKQTLGGDLTDRKKFMIRLQAIYQDWTDADVITIDGRKKITNSGAYQSAHYKGYVGQTVFEGIIDFKTLKEQVYNDGDGELSFVKNFSVMDKLTALNTLNIATSRTRGTINPWVNTFNGVGFSKAASSNDVSYTNASILGTDAGASPANSPKAGDIISDAFIDGSSHVLLTFAAQLPYTGYLDRMYYIGLGESTVFNSTGTSRTGLVGGVYESALAYAWNDYLFYGQDIYIWQSGVSHTFYDGTGVGLTVTGSRITGIDGIKLLTAIVKNTWPDVTVINRMTGPVGSAVTTMPIPLNWIFRLIDDFPLGMEPLDALKSLANVLGAYMFYAGNGDLVIQNKYSLEYWSGATINIPMKGVKGMGKSDFWDKLTDSVAVAVTSWIPNPGVPGAYYDGAGSAFKVTGIKARNELKITTIPDSTSLTAFGFTVNADGTLSYAGIYTQAEMLNKYGDLKAAEYLAFYGKRHAVYDVQLQGLTLDYLAWEMLDVVAYNGINYFLVNVGFDIDDDSGSFQMVEIAGHDYQFENVVIGQARDTYLSGN